MTPALLNVRQFVCSGDYQSNCYLLWPADAGRRSEADSPCWIIDPGFGADEVIDAIARERLAPAAILLTHGHMDHIAGIPEIRGRWPGLEICVSRGEADALQSPEVNLSAAIGLPVALADRADRLLGDGDALALGALAFRVLIVGGHSPAGACYHCPASGDVFTGDVLFAGSIGRSDFPGGDARLLVSDIRRKLLTLDGATRVWPGHGPATTIEREKRSNQFL